MENYIPTMRPPADEWLSAEEGDRIDLVVDHHLSEGVELPDQAMHASIHVIVENQIALGVVAVREAESRLLRQGLDRHEAIHAIGAVLTDQLHSTLASECEFDENHYRSRLNKLTAKRWKKGKW